MPILNKIIALVTIVPAIWATQLCAGTVSESKALYDAGIKKGLEGKCGEAEQLFSEAYQQVNNERNAQNIAQILRIAKDCVSGLISQEIVSLLFECVEAGNQGAWNTAASKAKDAESKNMSYAPTYINLGTVYSRLFVSGSGDKYADMALGAYKKAVTIEPHNGYAHYNLGLAYAGQRSWDDAKSHLKKAESYGIAVSSQIKSMVENASKKKW